MSHRVDHHQVGLRHRRKQSAPTTSASPITRADQFDVTAYAPLRYGPYRKTSTDPAFVRVIAGFTLVTGLLMGIGPTALSEVGRLFASLPALFTQGIPTPGASGTDTGDVTNDTAPTDAGVQHP